VIGVISRYISDWSECQDVAQETFIRAYRAIAAFRGDSQFYTWMYKIATNTAKNHLVSQGRRRRPMTSASTNAVQLDGGARLKTVLRRNTNCCARRLNEPCSTRSNNTAGRPEDRDTLREVDGLSYEQIAETMNCPIGTVRSRIFRARDAIDQKCVHCCRTPRYPTHERTNSLPINSGNNCLAMMDVNCRAISCGSCSAASTRTRTAQRWSRYQLARGSLRRQTILLPLRADFTEILMRRITEEAAHWPAARSDPSALGRWQRDCRGRRRSGAGGKRVHKARCNRGSAVRRRCCCDTHLSAGMCAL